MAFAGVLLAGCSAVVPDFISLESAQGHSMGATPMIKSLLVGMPMMVLCLLVQVAAAYWSVRNYMRSVTETGPRPGFARGCLPLVVAMLIMMAGNTLQIALWGGLFVLLGEFTVLEEAAYHSAVNYASLGYGDIVMSAKWRMLGGLEALNGVLMLGMTGAALMAILQHMIRQRGSDGTPAQ